jgi:hypothetical protein
MDQSLIMELIKELTVGFKAARSYPAGHPVFEKAVMATMPVLNRLFAENPEFTLTISRDAVTVQGSTLEIDNNLALSSLVDNLVKINIRSIRFSSAAKQSDMVNLYAVIASVPNVVEKAGGAAAMLQERGTVGIIINAAAIAEADNRSVREGTRSHEEIIEAIRNLMEIVRARPAVSDSRAPFMEVLGDIGNVSKGDWRSYSEAMVGIVDLLPLEKRVALLQDVEMKPFVLVLLSCLGNETLVELMTNWERQGKRDQIVRVMGVIGKDKFKEIVPLLKNRQVNVYEYLTNAGINLLIEDDVASTISKEDLKIALQPYYNMLDAHDANNRVQAVKSLIKFTKRLISEKKYEMINGLMLRIASAIEQESDDNVIIRYMGEAEDLYSVLKMHSQQELCDRLIEALGRVMGRGQLSLTLRKEIIRFLSATNDPSVLPTLFSFLWESGLYPDVRSAIISFGGHAANAAIQFLRDAEDFSVRMKLIDILKNIGEPSIKVLAGNLQAREWFLRRNIVRIFGEIGDPKVVPILEPLLRDEDHRVRIELARTYGKLEYKEGLLRSLNDISHEVKGEALRGLKRLIDAEGVIELLPRLSETGDEVYVELLKIIDEKKVLEAINWIADILKRLEWRKDATADEIKKAGVAALAKLDGDNAKMILLDLQKSKDRTLANLAATTLRRIG